ncbi:MAG: T9SS type A sorting domain-containing protein [Bacteroidales bacterium]|nr:T9SS type A sorting domain-containing protein [Bacteroidales bacterium]
MKRFILSLIFVGFISKMIAQISFIGFDQTQCGIIINNGYTFENISMMCGSHSSGYKIYKDGNEVYEKCIEFGGCSVFQLQFINDTTGFLIESNPNGHTVYKTNNSGTSWTAIGGGTPTLLGFYLVNSNTGYLVTTWDSPKAVYITRVSDINQRIITDNQITNDTIISDTIFGNPFCSINALNIKIKNVNDTVNYKIEFNLIPLTVSDYQRNNSFNIFPNPAKDFIEIDNKEIQLCDSYIRIYNNIGDIVKVHKIKDTSKLYIGDLKTGVYLLEISTKDTKAFYKIVKN